MLTSEVLRNVQETNHAFKAFVINSLVHIFQKEKSVQKSQYVNFHTRKSRYAYCDVICKSLIQVLTQLITPSSILFYKANGKAKIQLKYPQMIDFHGNIASIIVITVYFFQHFVINTDLILMRSDKHDYFLEYN